MNGSGPGLFEAVIESWRLVIVNAATLAKGAVIPFLLFMALNRLESLIKPEGMAILPWTLLLTVLAAVPAVILLMPWYRKLLAVGEPSLASRPKTWWSIILMMRWAGLDAMFFAMMMPITIISIQIVAAGTEATPRPELALVYYASIALGSYLVYGRMGLALPAAAAETDHGYRRSWAATADSGWRIGLAILLCWLSVLIPIDLLRHPLAVEDPTLAMQYLDAALGALFRVVNELLGAAVFAQFYLAHKSAPRESEG